MYYVMYSVYYDGNVYLRLTCIYLLSQMFYIICVYYHFLWKYSFYNTFNSNFIYEEYFCWHRLLDKSNSSKCNNIRIYYGINGSNIWIFIFISFPWRSLTMNYQNGGEALRLQGYPTHVFLWFILDHLQWWQ